MVPVNILIIGYYLNHDVGKRKRMKSVRFVWFPKTKWLRDLFLDGAGGFQERGKETPNPFSRVDFEIISVHKPRRSRVVNRALEIVKNPLHGDIDVSLMYPYRYNAQTFKANSRIWFTGENIRPPMDSTFHSFLSFDQDSYDGRNFYMPTWLQYLAMGDSYHFPHLGVKISEKNLLEKRTLNREKEKFICVIMRNRNITRLRAIKELSRLGNVDVYGPASGSFLRSKFSTASQYKYTLCFENDLFPGYVTEKLIEAYATKTVPLYWGDLGNETRLNQNAFINLKNFNNLREFVDYISSINQDEYKQIYEQPFLTQECHARNIINDALSHSKQV
jgi:hypothetical protein